MTVSAFLNILYDLMYVLIIVILVVGAFEIVTRRRKQEQ